MIKNKTAAFTGETKWRRQTTRTKEIKQLTRERLNQNNLKSVCRVKQETNTKRGKYEPHQNEETDKISRLKTNGLDIWN